MNNVKIIDDFLPQKEFESLQKYIVWNWEFPMYFHNKVAYGDERVRNWNWYATHIIMVRGKPCSESYYSLVSQLFFPRFVGLGLSDVSRIKVNFYPNTPRLKEHDNHNDSQFGKMAAIFGLNTCNGFTRIKGSGKIKSVENRLFIFDGTQPHNSSTTTDAQARWNINFNFI